MSPMKNLHQLIAWVHSRPNDHDRLRDRAGRRLLRRHERTLAGLRERRRLLHRQFAQADRRGDSTALYSCAALLARVVDQIGLLESLLPQGPRSAEQIVISSWMLADSFRICTETTDEGMHFLAGIEVDGLAIATRIIRCDYAHRSWAAARSDQVSTQRAIISTYEAGHRLLALIHAHPGSGLDANHSSSVDRQTQRAFEQTTRMIGGIWSRDACIRWFSTIHPFKVLAVGKHVEQIDETVFRLDLESDALAM